MKKILFRVSLVLVVLAAGWAGYRMFQQMPQRQQQVPTTRVRRGDVIVRSFSRGELRAVRSASLTAPNLFGTVQVTRLAPLGSFAREKDLVIEFDDSEVRSRLEEKELEMEQIDEQVKKAEADLAIRNNQDQVELLRARYSVRRAELEVKRNELISQIDAKKNLLNLEEARRRLKQLESDIKSRQLQAEAELAVLQERKNKAVIELAREKRRLSQVKLLSPMSGLVSVRQNSGGFRMMGMQSPDIREGDQVQPGMPVADVLDLSELEITAKVGELDRANLHEGQDVLIALDAIAEHRFHGKIKNMSGTATANVMSSDPGKKFDVNFLVEMKDLLSALGAKPEQIKKVLETAEQNRKKPPMVSFVSSIMGNGLPGGGGVPSGPGGGGMMFIAGGGAPSGPASGGGGVPGGPSAASEEAGGGAARGGGQRRMSAGASGGGAGGSGAFANVSEEDRKKMQAALQKATGGKNIQDLSPEERTKVFAKLRSEFPQMTRPRGERPAGGAPSGPKGTDAAKSGAAPGSAGERGGGRRGGAGAEMPVLGLSSTSQFSEKDLADAKLPPPPEEDTQLEVLLRPGLLADVEIIVEKLPNVIHIPAQALFEKDGKPMVYVRAGNRWDERLIKPLKRSESTLIVESGLNAGELVALSNPNAKPGDKKKKTEKSEGGGGAPMGGVGGGKRGGQ
ncbi:MAG: efflux RND transporter periplasmic adaptor subunit [Acidobacteria bacterium]|nr:efflux RND transporter periplasmic adaptor subunit [Acidobacteriota bacterium]